MSRFSIRQSTCGGNKPDKPFNVLLLVLQRAADPRTEVRTRGFFTKQFRGFFLTFGQLSCSWYNCCIPAVLCRAGLPDLFYAKMSQFWNKKEPIKPKPKFTIAIRKLVLKMYYTQLYSLKQYIARHTFVKFIVLFLLSSTHLDAF